MCASTVASNLAVEVSLATSHAFIGASPEPAPLAPSPRAVSTFFRASRYFLPCCFGTLPDDLQAHRPSRPLDHLHSLVELIGVEVLHLDLRNLSELIAGHPADLVTVRLVRSLLDAGG